MGASPIIPILPRAAFSSPPDFPPEHVKNAPDKADGYHRQRDFPGRPAAHHVSVLPHGFAAPIILDTASQVSTTLTNLPSLVLIKQLAPSVTAVLRCPGTGACRLVTLRGLILISRPGGPCSSSSARSAACGSVIAFHLSEQRPRQRRRRRQFRRHKHS